MKRIVACFLLLLTAFFLLSSCAREEKSCEELLMLGLEYGIDGYRNNGYIYLKEAEEGESLFFSEKKKKTVYGERFLEILEDVEDFAIYFSASTPYEIAVFKSATRNLNDGLVRMCYERADQKKVGLRFTEWEVASKSITVSVYRTYVFFIFTDSAERNEGVEAELRGALGG